MIVFDMAGTTVNENNVVYKTLQTAINEAGFDVTLDQVLAEGAGKEKFQAIKDVLKTYTDNTDQSKAESIYGNFTFLLEQAYQDIEIEPIDGAEELFHQLKKKHIFVILNTGYNEKTARTLLDKLDWHEGGIIDGLVTASDVKDNRPKPDMILLAMKKFGIRQGQEVVKVGDSIIDIQEGANAGCKLNIGITTGAHTYEQLRSAHPDRIIHNLLELLPILEEC